MGPLRNWKLKFSNDLAPSAEPILEKQAAKSQSKDSNASDSIQLRSPKILDSSCSLDRKRVQDVFTVDQALLPYEACIEPLLKSISQKITNTLGFASGCVIVPVTGNDDVDIHLFVHFLAKRLKVQVIHPNASRSTDVSYSTAVVFTSHQVLAMDSFLAKHQHQSILVFHLLKDHQPFPMRYCGLEVLDLALVQYLNKTQRTLAWKLFWNGKEPSKALEEFMIDRSVHFSLNMFYHCMNKLRSRNMFTTDHGLKLLNEMCCLSQNMFIHKPFSLFMDSILRKEKEFLKPWQESLLTAVEQDAASVHFIHFTDLITRGFSTEVIILFL
jgi:hypothetical protein